MLRIVGCGEVVEVVVVVPREICARLADTRNKKQTFISQVRAKKRKEGKERKGGAPSLSLGRTRQDKEPDKILYQEQFSL